LHLLKVSVLPLAIKALIHFWDPDYHCFTFGDINMVPTIKKYSVLTYFPEDVYKLYFHRRLKNTMEKFAKLLGIYQMNQYREKNNSRGLRWKWLEELLVVKKSNPGARILALRVFGLVLCPYTAEIVNLEAANLFIEYENTKINPFATILDETIISLNHSKKTRKGSMRCCVSLLFIWMVRHIEAETLIFRSFWWFDTKQL
jgi:hypothetical protein